MDRITPTRRRFMHGLATTSAALFTGPYILRAADVNKERLRIAYVATGGQAGSHLPLVEQSDKADDITKNHSCPCFAEVDKKRWDRIKQLQPDATGYTDYRKMFDKHMKEIDAVVVTTPDHSHAAASMIAIKNGKHCYTEKPLTWSIDEARKLAEATKDKKVATQMGNMGHANEGNRRIVEIVRSGLLGDIQEVHTWTNRPVWDQGIAQRPPTKPVPEGLDWDCWIGPAEKRDYHEKLHSFGWRGWYDFGCGAIGDMGCHTWDNVFWSMDPDYPTRVELVGMIGSGRKETYPKQSIVRWDFPEKKGRPAFVAYWYEGGLKPPVPDEIKKDETRSNKNLPDSGNLYVGTKGKMLVSGDYGDGVRLIPESFQKEAKFPEKTIPRSPGHKNEWILACTGEKPWNYPGSNFADYAAPLTEVMLIGAIAIRMNDVGGVIECDPTKREIKTREARKYLSRDYRRGWSL